MRDRFYVVESRGYQIDLSGKPGKWFRGAEVLVLDRGYCHEVVWSSWSSVMAREERYPRRFKSGNCGLVSKTYHATASHWPLAKARAYAADLAARLNVEAA